MANVMPSSTSSFAAPGGGGGNGDDDPQEPNRNDKHNLGGHYNHKEEGKGRKSKTHEGESEKARKKRESHNAQSRISAINVEATTLAVMNQYNETLPEDLQMRHDGTPGFENGGHENRRRLLRLGMAHRSRLQHRLRVAVTNRQVDQTRLLAFQAASDLHTRELVNANAQIEHLRLQLRSVRDENNRLRDDLLHELEISRNWQIQATNPQLRLGGLQENSGSHDDDVEGGQVDELADGDDGGNDTQHAS